MRRKSYACIMKWHKTYVLITLRYEQNLGRIVEISDIDLPLVVLLYKCYVVTIRFCCIAID